MIDQSTYTVTTGATQLVAARGVDQIVTVTNLGSATLYIGESDVSTTTGFEVLGGETYSIDISAGLPLYGVTGTSTTVLVLVASLSHPRNVPKRITLAGIGSAITVATVASSVAGLGPGSADGALGIIRLGTWPDQSDIHMTWNSTQSKWVSEPFPLLTTLDQQYIGSNTTSYTYAGTDMAGGVSAGLGYATKAIDHADLIFTAGLTLQQYITGIFKGSGGGVGLSVQPVWFQHNVAEDTSNATTYANRVAEGTAINSPASSTPSFGASGWNYLVLPGTSTVATNAVITKRLLWPRIFAKVASGVAYGGLIDMDIQARWIG